MPGTKLTAIYDLGWYAPTFDILEFLTGAMIWEQANGFRGIRLIILQRPLSQSLILQPQLPAEYDFRIRDILMGAANLFPLEEVRFTSDIAAVRALAQADRGSLFPPIWNDVLAQPELEAHRYYLQGFLRDHVKSGAPLPGIRVPAFAFKKMRALLMRLPRPWITITVRRTAHLLARNSNLAIWKAVADHFTRAGASVFFIPDLETLEDFEAIDPISVMALSNLSYRAALYDGCDLNLSVANGSAAPLLFNPSASWVIGKFTTEGTNASLQSVEKLLGMRPGDDFWNRVPWQSVLWSDDDDAAEIIWEAERSLDFMKRVQREIVSQPLLCDPWGKPDGTIRDMWKGLDADMPEDLMRRELQQRVADPALSARLKEWGVYSCKRRIVEAEDLLARNQLNDALGAAKEAIRLDGRYARPHLIAADCLGRLGQEHLAKRYLASAHTLQ